MATQVSKTDSTKWSLPFQDMISKLTRLDPKLLSQSNVKNLRLAFACVFAFKHLWEIFLILKNLWCIADFNDLPPAEYEIPPNGSEIAVWKNECALARKLCEYHLLLNAYDFIANATKLFTGYYDNIWGRTGEKVTGMLPRALWFVTIDHAVTYTAMFFSNLFIAHLLAARHGVPNVCSREDANCAVYWEAKPGAEKVDHFNNFKDIICAVIIFDMFGLTGIAWLIALNRFLDLFFYRKFEFETNSYSQIAKSTLPGCKEIIDLANQMGFFKRDLLLETRAAAPPEAVHYNFITSDVIVVTKSLLEKLPPNQSKSVVGLAMIHWKAGYCYWDHFGHLVFLCGKLYICAVIQDVSRFFNIEGEVHPAVILTLVYTVVFPVIDDIVYGLAGWVHTCQVFNCDASIEDANSSLVYLKRALVRLADLPGSHKFDGWYSSWFFGKPSLIDRIPRIRRRTS